MGVTRISRGATTTRRDEAQFQPKQADTNIQRKKLNGKKVFKSRQYDMKGSRLETKATRVDASK